jgi:hypothetical protein
VTPAVRDLAPPSIVDRPKLGFPTPTAQWLRGELAAWAHAILSSSTAGDLINLFARQMLAQHQSGEADCPHVVDLPEFLYVARGLKGFSFVCKPAKHGKMPIYRGHGNAPSNPIGGSTHDDR